MEASQQPDQNARILQVYNIYRIVLTLVLLFTFISSPVSTQLGSHNPDLFINTVLGYGGFSLLVLILIKPGHRFTIQQHLISTLLIVDILAIATISYSCRGMISGLGLLHLVTIAAGSILVVGRISTFLPAIASIATIYTEVYLSLTTNGTTNQYMQAGLLGALLFAGSLSLQSFAERMRRSAILTAQQAASIFNLEQLNQLIIQRMSNGIAVVDSSEQIITANDAACGMLNLGGLHFQTQLPSQTRTRLPEILQQHLSQWRVSPNKRLPPFQIRKPGPFLQASFEFLNPSADSSILIFIEDSSQFIQQVRQMKLASLGRLTASIAHEIRNPLGAISHASQLLQESPHLDNADQRLLKIILNHCGRVNVIIEDVLQMSRQKHDSAERINLREWLEHYIENYCSTHQINGRIEINIQPPETEVRVITSHLEQILNNLIENGLRYSERSTGKADLTLKGGLERRGELRSPVLHVIDEGVGIAPETEEHLFEPFHTTENSGTGLGLYISKELCEANQAELSYCRTDNGRSCFSIYFLHPDRNAN